MSHNFETQRRDTYASFKNTQGVKLPKEAVVEFLFFIEELDANWHTLEKALQAAGFRTRRLEDKVSLVASYGPMPVTPEAIWQQEREATSIALKHDFYPDGWELAE